MSSHDPADGSVLAVMFIRQLQAYLSLFMCANLAIGRRPTCLFQKSELGWKSCNGFIQQDRNEICCAIGNYPFRKIIRNATINTINGSVQTMFNFSSHLDNVKHMFVLDHSKRCLMPSECFLLDADSSFSFKQNVQFKLTGDEPFHVLYFSETEYNHWILNTTSKECKYFQASSIMIDQDGESRSDLILHIRPPDGNQVAQANISSVCLYIHSAKTRNNFTCTGGVKSQGEIKKHFCIDNPFGNGGVLRIDNATHFYNGSHDLTHHCVQANMGAYCYVLSEMLIVTPPQDRKPTNAYYIPHFLTPALWILTSFLCAALVFSCLVYLLRRSRNHHKPDPVSPEEPLIERHSFRGVLLYCKEDSQLENIVVDLIDIIARDKRVEIVNPYSQAELRDAGAPTYAHCLLKPGTYILSLKTVKGQAIRNAPSNDVPDIFDQFYLAACRIIEAQPTLFTVLNLTFWTVVDDANAEPVYLLPEKIEDLLRDIVGGEHLNDFGIQVKRLGKNIYRCAYKI